MDGTGSERVQGHPGILLNMLGRESSAVQANREPFPPRRLLKSLNKAGRQFEYRLLKDIVLH